MKKEEQRLIRLEFVTTKTNSDILEKKLLSLKDTKVLIKKPETDSGKMAFSAALSGLPPEQIYMLILTIGSNIATVASFLYQILHDKENKKQSITFSFR
jgi:hypothetical protein